MFNFFVSSEVFQVSHIFLQFVSLDKKLYMQIRSHAQKYFLKVQKNGTVAHVPPPQPKRKAAHPYPQKASKNG